MKKLIHIAYYSFIFSVIFVGVVAIALSTMKLISDSRDASTNNIKTVAETINIKDFRKYPMKLSYNYNEFYTMCTMIRTYASTLHSQHDLLPVLVSKKEKAKINNLNHKVSDELSLTIKKYNSKAERIDSKNSLEKDGLPTRIDNENTVRCS